MNPGPFDPQQSHDRSEERRTSPDADRRSHVRGSAQSASEEARHVARSTRTADLAAGHAVLVGNLAGVVEWTDEAWASLTGFPLVETIGKPISHFLEHAGIEIELVDFVAQHFLEGRDCTVELPFDTFDGRKIDVILEVEPHRSESGEVTRFVAVARLAEPNLVPRTTPSNEPQQDPRSTPTNRQGLHAHENRNAGIAGTTASPPVHSTIDANAIIRAAIDTHRPRLSQATIFESLLEAGPLLAMADAPRLTRLVGALFSLVSPDAPFLTVVTGRLRAGRSHHSLVHAIPARGVAARKTDGCFIEFHETGLHLDRGAVERIRRGRPGQAGREHAIARVYEEASAIGGTLFVDSTPGCGTQLLLTFDAASD